MQYAKWVKIGLKVSAAVLAILAAHEVLPPSFAPITGVLQLLAGP